jgi:glycosyltransferase involved in cell wall biosynthesis
MFGLKRKPTGILRFLHVSTLKDEHKNISGILRSVKRLNEKRQDFEMLIVGDGDVTPHIKYAKELNVLNVLKIEGGKSINEIARIMHDSDVFVLFSNYENLPCVISEAHCCGLPVISTDVGGIKEMIDDSNGLLIKPKDEDSLYRSMLYMLDNYINYNYLKIREDAISKYSYEKIGRRFFEIYNDILNKQ